MGQPPKRAMAHPSPGHVSGLNDRYVRLALALVVAAGGALAGWTYRLDREVARLHAALRAATTEGRSWQERVEEERRRARAHRRSLEDRIETTRRREGELRRRLAVAAGEAEVEAVRAELRQLQWRLVALEGERAAAERIIRDYGAGVCLIHASYAFYDANGRPLRYRVDASGQKVREADGSVAVQVGGSGPVHSLDAVGTGFLADRRGRVVTNRHVVEPWWKDKTAESLAKYGYEPRLLFLHVFFPGVGEALGAEVRRVSSTVDLAVLDVNVEGRKIPALPLDDSGEGAVPGQPVVVLGYPTGVEAILAKTASRVVEEILAEEGTGTERITEALSRRGLIRPSTTQGHIGDVTKTDIVFDAPTTQGGSGGPVFNKHGRVIAVEYAMLPQFSGSSYGVPVRRALELLEKPPP